MMTRIYCWAYETKEELDERVKAFQEAQKRDHKKLGKELNLFTIDEEVGKGLPLWLPNGTVLRDEIEKLMRELEFEDGYQRVSTPCLTKTSLYHKTAIFLITRKECFHLWRQVRPKKEERLRHMPLGR